MQPSSVTVGTHTHTHDCICLKRQPGRSSCVIYQTIQSHSKTWQAHYGVWGFSSDLKLSCAICGVAWYVGHIYLENIIMCRSELQLAADTATDRMHSTWAYAANSCYFCPKAQERDGQAPCTPLPARLQIHMVIACQGDHGNLATDFCALPAGNVKPGASGNCSRTCHRLTEDREPRATLNP